MRQIFDCRPGFKSYSIPVHPSCQTSVVRSCEQRHDFRVGQAIVP